MQDMALRKVVFIKHGTQNNSKEEDDVSSMEKHLRNALTRNNFQIVDYVIPHVPHGQRTRSNSKSMNALISKMNLNSFHRIFYFVDTNSLDYDFVSGEKNDNVILLNHDMFVEFSIRCKVRILLANVDLLDKFDRSGLLPLFAKKQILFGHSNHDDDDDRGTFLGSFIFEDEDITQIRRIILKNTSERHDGLHDRFGLVRYDVMFKDEINEIVDNLLNYSNITMHVICDGSHPCIHKSQGDNNERVIIHYQKNLSTEEHSALLSKCAFTLGANVHLKYASIWIDIAFGNVVINIHRNHPLYRIEAPFKVSRPYYVTHAVNELDGIVADVELAMRSNIDSFIPSQLRSGTMSERVCAILEDDSLCSCPNPTFQVTPEAKSALYEKYGNDTIGVDCRSNMDAKKEPTFPTMK